MQTSHKARLLARLLPVLAIVVLPCIFFYRNLQPGQMLFGSDVVFSFYYIRAFVGQTLAAGNLPTWDPHSFCGYPLLAGMQAAVFYPLTWLSAVLPPGAAWTWTALLHLILAGVFAWLWLKRGLGTGSAGALVGALVYMLSSHILSHTYAGHITMVAAYPWLPAVLWRTERLLTGPDAKRLALFSLVFALLVLAGYPMYAFFAGLLVLVRLLHHSLFDSSPAATLRRARWSVLSGLVLAACLSAPQLLPTLELTGHTQRAAGNPYDFTTSYSLPPENLLTLIAPTVYGGIGNAATPYWGRWLLWEVSGFIGIASLVLALIAILSRCPHRWLWAGLALAGVLLALGRYAPFFRVFHAVVPGAGYFRSPGRYLLVTTIALLPLVAHGVQHLACTDARRAALRAGLVAAAAAILIGGVLFLVRAEDGNSIFWRQVLAAMHDAPDTSLQPAALNSEAFRTISFNQAVAALERTLMTCVLIAAVLLVYSLTRLPGAACAALLGAVLLWELLTFGTDCVTGYDEKRQAWPQGLQEALAGMPDKPFRLTSIGNPRDDEPTKDIGRAEMYGFDHAGGYDPLLLARYAELMNAIQGREADQYLIASEPSRVHPVMDMLGVKVYLAHGQGRPHPKWLERGRYGDTILFQSPSALPRAFLVPRAKVIGDPDKRLAYLADTSFAPSREVVLEEEPATVPGTQGAGAGRVSKIEAQAGNVVIEAQSPEPCYLVLSESWYPGWGATIDGREANILRANHFIQAVQLPAGTHTVRFAYTCRFLAPGALLACAALAVLAWQVLRERRQPQSPAPA